MYPQGGHSPLAGHPCVFDMIKVKNNTFIPTSRPIRLNGRYDLLPGAEVLFRDPLKRTIIASSQLRDNKTGEITSQYLVELPQGFIVYQATRKEIIERIAIDTYKILLVDGVSSTAQNAVHAVKNIVRPKVLRDDPFILKITGKTNEGYRSITVELRY